MLLFALVRAIEVVGEAAGRVGEATRGAAADIPWGLIVPMRNRLIHAYFDVDNDVVWKAATEELPALLPKSAEGVATGQAITFACRSSSRVARS